MPYHVLYASSAVRQMTSQELADLLEQSRSKNKRLGITGFLVYRDGAFLQMLEGERGAVTDLYETIKGDDRHHSVTTLRTVEAEQREFSDWAMGFRDLSGEDLDELRDSGGAFGTTAILERLDELSEAPGHGAETLRRFADR